MTAKSKITSYSEISRIRPSNLSSAHNSTNNKSYTLNYPMKLCLAVSRGISLASRASWVCRACSKQLYQPSIFPKSSKRSIKTRANPPAPKIVQGLQGLIESEPLSRSAPTYIPKERPLSRAESRAIQRLDILLEDSQVILQKDVIPTEEETLEALKICRGLAAYFRDIKDKPALTTVKPGGEAGNLLFLEDPQDGNAAKRQLSPTMIGSMASYVAENATDMIATAVNNIAEDGKVFITPKILHRVVEILSLLNRPQSLAKVFIFYSEKPIPVPGSVPIQYKPANPNKISAAISFDVAKTALDAGIKVQNLPLCLDIIEHTVRTTAYKRSKITRKALLPGTIAAMAPGAAYVMASQLAQMQDAMSTNMATIVGTAGIITYLGATGTMGFITIATANDQMERVTWASGIHLRQRWLREDERAFMDTVACAWGFQDRNRRGEEEGPEWEALRELCGMRGMILDRVGLMDGMQ